MFEGPEKARKLLGGGIARHRSRQEEELKNLVTGLQDGR